MRTLWLVLSLSALANTALAQDACTTYYKKLYEQGVPTQQINKLKKEIADLAQNEREAHCAKKAASK